MDVLMSGPWPLGPSSDLLVSLRNHGGEARERNMDAPHVGSRQRERVGESEFVRSQLANAYAMVDLRLLVAEDHLLAIGDHIRGAGAIYAAYSAARTAAEMAARAWWLIAPRLNARQRVERALADMFRTLKEQAKLGGEARALAMQHAAELEAAAEAEVSRWPSVLQECLTRSQRFQAR